LIHTLEVTADSGAVAAGVGTHLQVLAHRQPAEQTPTLWSVTDAEPGDLL